MHRIIVVIVILAICGCSSTQTRDIESYSYNLDVPSNRYSSIDFKSVGDTAVVNIKASFIEQRKTPNWNPSASFQLFSADGNSLVALVISNRDGINYQPFLIVKARDPNTNEVTSSEPIYFEKELPFNKEFSLHLIWQSNESFSVTINDTESKSVPIKFVVEKLRSSNSAGEIDVISLVVEKM